jgi:hypothetical protein
MRKARTITRIVAVYLLLGLVTTWAVAWGLALLPPGTRRISDWAQYPAADKITDPSSLVLYTYVVGRTGLGLARAWYSTDELAPRMKSNILFRSDEDTRGLDPFESAWIDVTLCFDLSGFDGWGMRRVGLREGMESFWSEGIDDARGFPFLALWCSWKEQRQSSANAWSPTVKLDSLKGGIPLPDHPAPNLSVETKARALPYYPIWSGLALNTAFYALLFFIVVRTAKAFSRSRRHARGLCPRCKYDREFDYRMPCPECGHQACVRRAAVV